MDAKQPPSVGAKDLKDLKGVSRVPAVAYLQKQAVPDAPRDKPVSAAEAAAPPLAAAAQATAPVAAAVTKAVYQKLELFAKADWRKWLYEYVRYRLGPRHAFQTYEGQQPADGTYALAGDAAEIRLALAGDWGTGTDEAFKIAGLMAASNPHYTIHLGDIYFVGDGREVRENFLGRAGRHSRYTPCTWPKGSRGSFALNGNHEMYARGIAYFDEILPALGEMTDGSAQGQKASYFRLQNDDWCILGLDTAYNSVQWPLVEYLVSPDCSLPPPNLAWLRAIADGIGDRAVIILTHHQVLSVYDACFPKAADQIFSLLKKPVLWFWGHEHRLVVYEPYARADGAWPVITGRCIGHGGMPVDPPGVPKPGLIGTAEFIDDRLYRNDEALHVGMNGFARLAIAGKALRVEYVDIHGDVVLTETFEAAHGGVSRTGVTNHALHAVAGDAMRAARAGA